MSGLSEDIEEFVTSHEPKAVTESVVASKNHPNTEVNHDETYYGLDQIPTEHERATLRRVPDTIPLSTFRKSYLLLWLILLNTCIVIAFVELAERFSFYGSSVVFVSHLTRTIRLYNV